LTPPTRARFEDPSKAREQARARQLQSVVDALAGSKGAEDLLGPSRFRSKTVAPEVRKAALEAGQTKEELITPTIMLLLQ
jgi:hypothetical protein